jgi:hypothetical protein
MKNGIRHMNIRNKGLEKNYNKCHRSIHAVLACSAALGILGTQHLGTR